MKVESKRRIRQTKTSSNVEERSNSIILSEEENFNKECNFVAVKRGESFFEKVENKNKNDKRLEFLVRNSLIRRSTSFDET